MEGKRLDQGALLGGARNPGRLDAALLLTTSGEVLGSWTRTGLRREVLSVMSATLMASVDTLMEELRGHRPEYAVVEAGDQRFLSLRTGDDHLIVLSAASSVPPDRLLALARTLEKKLPGTSGKWASKTHVIAPRA